jgi:hypothetical protein
MLKVKLPEFLTELEHTVLQAFLQSELEDVCVLGEQLASCSLKSREHNGYGFYTNFQVDDIPPRCAKENFELGGVSVVLSGQLCGFLLFVREGKVEFLEGFPLGGDEWPTPENIEKVIRD